MTEFLKSLGIALIVLVLMPVLALVLVLLVIYDIVLGIATIAGITTMYCVERVCRR